MLLGTVSSLPLQESLGHIHPAEIVRWSFHGAVPPQPSPSAPEVPSRSPQRCGKPSGCPELPLSQIHIAAYFLQLFLPATFIHPLFMHSLIRFLATRSHKKCFTSIIKRKPRNGHKDPFHGWEH